jgi:protein dithiol:quinone oxidoreductase
MMQIPSRRTVNASAFAFCAAMMGYAYYAQFALELEPCPLCIFQRVFMIITGIFFMLVALHDPGRIGRMIYTGLLTLATAGGAAIAGRHIWLQSLPPDQVPVCGPGLDYMLEVFSYSETLAMVFTGSGECAEVKWTLLGFSMPVWVLAAFIGLGVVGLLNNLRRTASDA